MDRDIVLDVIQLTHWFGSKVVLFDVNFKVVRGEIVSIVGPSGCGKSTLLYAIMGMQPPANGRVVINDKFGKSRIITTPSRDVGIVFQRYSLFPDRTVLDNVALGLMLDETRFIERNPILRWVPFHRRRRGLKISWSHLKKIHRDEAAALLEKLRLKDAIDKYPHQLSGGMQQRAAIAQALIMKPSILLLDEPFGALDRSIRIELQDMLLQLYEENVAAKKQGKMPEVTFIIVTHELEEAVLVGDRVIGLSQFWDSLNYPDPMAKGAATIIYDKVAPVFKPEGERENEILRLQCKELYSDVFDPHTTPKRDTHVQFWGQLQSGEADAIFGNENILTITQPTKSAHGGFDPPVSVESNST